MSKQQKRPTILQKGKCLHQPKIRSLQNVWTIIHLLTLHNCSPKREGKGGKASRSLSNVKYSQHVLKNSHNTQGSESRMIKDRVLRYIRNPYHSTVFLNLEQGVFKGGVFTVLVASSVIPSLSGPEQIFSYFLFFHSSFVSLLNMFVHHNINSFLLDLTIWKKRRKLGPKIHAQPTVSIRTMDSKKLNDQGNHAKH